MGNGDQFGVQLEELSRIEQDFRTAGERMSGLNGRLGKIRETLAKAATVDLASSAFGGVAGVEVAAKVRESVKDIDARSQRLLAEQRRLTDGIAADAEKIKAVRAEYEETERRIEDGLTDRRGPAGPHPHPHPHPEPGPHPGPAPHPHPHPKQPGGDPGHHDGGSSNAGRIDISQVTYGGKGTWQGGDAACREYINQALDKLGITDPTARANWMRGMLTIADRESSMNLPTEQVNIDAKHDVNVHGPIQSDGAPLHCSRGGWQMTPGSFGDNHVPGTATDIYDPVANAAASIQYCMNRHGVSRDGSDLAAKVQQADPHRKAHWY